MKIQKYKRGQIWWYNNNAVWDGGTYNQGKSRPVIIVSNELANANSNTLIAVPCTSQDKKEMPTHTTFEINGIQNVAMAECLMSVSTDKLGSYVATLDTELIEKIEGNILVALGMKEIIKENAVKRIVVHNTDGQPKQDLALTLKMIEDAKKEKTKKVTKRKKPGPKKKRGRKPNYTLEYKIDFVKDYETNGKEFMIKKYNLKSGRTLNDRIYAFRKYIKEHVS